MLFNSAVFIFAFLPLAMIGFGLAYRRGGLESAWAWLALASVIFYSWWNPFHTPLLLASVGGNYWLGRRLSSPDEGGHKWLMTSGVVLNLGLLGGFKYWNFLAANVASLLGQTWEGTSLDLPLGISFYTFHQLTYLFYCRAGRAPDASFCQYLLYVTFFPQLIAGPIVRPLEMLPQLRQSRDTAFRWGDISIGFTLLSIGLFKKMVVADYVAQWVGPVFDHGGQGGDVAFLDAWVAALSYTFQLYFDFSAYSDMALGLAKLFSVNLPGNFFSPYKACSIVDFWRRWHITLSLFLRDYLYIPLGGNRKGELRRCFNLLVVMFIGGFWHGAGWTFGIWGLWHGVCLLVNHAWSQSWLGKLWARLPVSAFSWALTFLVVTIGWVLFRAPGIERALSLLSSMFGGAGVQVPANWLKRMPWIEVVGIEARSEWLVFSGAEQVFALVALFMIVLLLPNPLQIMREVMVPPNANAMPESKATRLLWKPTRTWALVSGVIFTIALLHLGKLSEFLYFQF
jgi:D-alanyl-lipoteichoic acid acyltransferase DltB (MBOAT superfamily)